VAFDLGDPRGVERLAGRDRDLVRADAAAAMRDSARRS
jgi:hypothetical protein